MWHRRLRSSDTSEPLRNDARDFVRNLRLPAVQNVRQLLPVIEEHLNQPVRLQAAEVGEAVPCGMWIATSTVSYIFFDPRTSPAHQDHIIAHEFAHILAGHHGSSTLPTPDAGGLLNLLDPALIRAVLGRTDYTHHDEQEAEMVGSFLQEHANSYRPPTRSEEADRITRTLLRG